MVEAQLIQRQQIQAPLKYFVRRVFVIFFIPIQCAPKQNINRVNNLICIEVTK